ncbi:MAG: molecular chaperone HtpG, partial [Clostridia bacterium]|nr:molecular chaperone HtpG [Clostridia bacterium]
MYGKGTVSINAENIMPVIKQWLYSDKDIFVRELVSNACDAISKLKRLANSGEANVESPDYRVDVICDEEKGTIEIIDNGIGMTGDEVIKYIAQVAFSGATDFIQKYSADKKDGEAGIIGHFGLGFYSCFMVSDRVEIETKSYIESEPAVRWVSEDGMDYDLEPCEKSDRGTKITLYIAEEDKDFLKLWTLRSTLEKHCAFMPVPVYVSERKADAEKQEEPQQINDTNPLWMKRPNECTDEEYLEFYHKVFHDMDDPLFWIHLNAEFPFNLKGILFFPKLKNEFSANEGVIKLFNNQVFVADNIKEVI